MQGTVDEGSVDTADGVTTFTMSFGGVSLPVRYEGEPGGIFAECEPVVVHGELGDDGVFRGDNIEVKHSNEYEAANPDRVDGERTACDHRRRHDRARGERERRVRQGRACCSP